MALSGIIAIPDLDKKMTKEVKIPPSIIRTIKTSFTHLLGSEDGSSAGLLMERLELWIASCPEFTVISKTNKMALCELICLICRDAIQARADLCKTLSEITSELTGLEVPATQEQTLLLSVSEFNKSSIKTLETTENWFNQLRLRLAETYVNVDVLAVSGNIAEKPDETPDIDLLSISGERFKSNFSTLLL